MGIRKGLPAKLALTDADDTRFDFKNLVASNADGTPRGGLISPVGTALITGTATMDVTVGAFAAAAIRDGGVILLSSDGAQTVTIGAAPPANQRTDIVYAKQNDASSTVSAPDANSLPILGVAVGTAGPSGGTLGALPPGAVELGRIILSAGNTNTNAGTITQALQYTASAGSAVPFSTLDGLGEWVAPPGQVGVVFADGGQNGVYQCLGGVWSRASSALVPIAPSSVAGSGASLGPGALVTLAAASTIDIEGVFSALYDEVLMYVEIDSSSGTGSITAQYRVGGVANTGANYRFSINDVTFAGAATPSGQIGATAFVAGLANGSGGTTSRTEFYATGRTGEKRSISTIVSASGRRDVGGWAAAAIGIPTGLRLICAAPLTGRVRFFGIVRS